MSVKVAKFQRFNLADIDAGLKEVGETIGRDAKANCTPQALIVCLGYADGTTRLFSYGKRCSPLETDGWLARALRRGGISGEKPLAVQVDDPSPDDAA